MLENSDGIEVLWFETQLLATDHFVKWVKVASLVFILYNAVCKPVITRPLMEGTYSLVCCSHHSTTVLLNLFNIISHLCITDRTDSITTVITLTITEITRYLKLNIHTFTLRWICFYSYFFNTLRTGSFKLFKRPFPGFLTILTL